MNQKGFSLVEIMIAVAVLGIVIACIFAEATDSTEDYFDFKQRCKMYCYDNNHNRSETVNNKCYCHSGDSIIKTGITRKIGGKKRRRR